MPPKLTDRTEPAAVTNGVAPPVSASRLPPSLRVPILVLISLSLRFALWQFASDFRGPELGDISRQDTELYQPLVHLAYKIGIVWGGWALGYDFLDISSLTLLSEAPYHYLLITYYNITHQTAAISILVELISTALPTYLLRPRSDVHSEASLPNRYLLNSFQVQSTTTALAVSVYVVAIWSALQAEGGFLNTFIVSHFDPRTLENAHSETPVTLIAKTLFVGWTAQAFLLNSSLAAQKHVSGSSTPVKAFKPATSSLKETFEHNYWMYSKRTKTLILQTAYLVVFMVANTTHRILNLKGTDVTGAVGYAGIWALATVVCAGSFLWVENA